MPPWVGSIFGLTLGLLLGGAVFVIFVLPGGPPPLPAMPQAPAPVITWQPRPPALPAPRPAQEPPVAEIPGTKAGGLTKPELEAMLRPPPGSAGARFGTGFFVAADGSLITAAHVVPDCPLARIASVYLPPTEAKVLVRDQPDDLALLRARVRPPAFLSVGSPATGSNRLFALGYPGGQPVLGPASETWAQIVTTASMPLPFQTHFPGTLWVENRDITHGYSGGPILDPISGKVVALTRGMILADKLPDSVHLPAPDLAMGPNSAVLSEFLRRATSAEPVTPVTIGGEGALQVARLATVRVYCWH
jgi:S1-C subfamily serine protease